ncbi:unnamed protein product, partial [Vitis vinifera]|uniref:Uncharacterized protein n=1 Tax=Vitis vinifera TaxID=29760 RepID=D7TD20_VITVI
MGHKMPQLCILQPTSHQSEVQLHHQ